MSRKQKIYLDYAATTSVDPHVEKVMRPYFGGKFGNPGSLHSFGQEAIAAVDRSRETIAGAIGASFREIIFTGSATEANNLALRGIAKGIKCHVSSIKRPRLIISAVEHESVLETARDLEREDVEIIYLPVSREGIVDLKKLKSALNERTVLVSVMYANNEIGTIQPIAEINKIIKEFRIQNLEFRENDKKNPKSYILNPISYPLFHADAVQVFQFLDCNVKNLGVDLMTLSAHKIYGPKGVGALYIRKQPATSYQQPATIITGGGQEFGLRSGTENVPNIVGFAKAVEITEKLRAKEANRVGALRDFFWHGIRKIYPKAGINGIAQSARRVAPDADDSRFAIRALPNILNVHFPGFLAEELLMRLDLAGVAVSSGSACSSRSSEPSHVIRALGYDTERAKRSIRFSFGRQTTRGEIQKTLGVLKGILV